MLRRGPAAMPIFYEDVEVGTVEQFGLDHAIVGLRSEHPQQAMSTFADEIIAKL